MNVLFCFRFLVWFIWFLIWISFCMFIGLLNFCLFNCLVTNVIHFSTGVFGFLLLGCESFYIFWILHPYYIWFTNTFSRRSRCWSRGMWSSPTSTNTSKYIYMWNNSQEYLLKACRRSHATKAARKISTCLGRTMGKREKTNTFSHSVFFFFSLSW